MIRCDRRGQLGHNDLEDCDNPRLIEALAGLKVTQISAGGWHSAVVTDQVRKLEKLQLLNFAVCCITVIFNNPFYLIGRPVHLGVEYQRRIRDRKEGHEGARGSNFNRSQE